MNSRFNDVFDKAAGKAQKSQGESLATFLASLATSGAILTLGVIIYIFLRWKYPEHYSQQAHRVLGTRWKPIPLHLWMLLSPIPDLELIYASGFDNYLFDRLLQTILAIFVLLGLVILPVLLPLNIIDGRNESGGVQGLDRLSYSNINPSHIGRYWAHLVLAMFAIILVCYTIQKELWDYARIQNNLGWDNGKGSCLLLTSSSANQLSASAIKQRFHNIGGGVRKVTINRDFSSLRTKICRRDALTRKLETAETILIMKSTRQGRSIQRADSDNNDTYSTSLPPWMKYLHHNDRPSMRLPLFPLLPALCLGPRVDAIHHLRIEVARYNLEIEWHQLHSDEFPLMNSAFVYFNGVLLTSLAALALQAQVPPTWTIKQGTTANDTIWRNVSISWWQQCIRSSTVYLLVALLTLGFAFPVTLIGSLSQIEYLVNVLPWLRWIDSLPIWLVAIIQGVLPPAMLALITLMVPAVIRLLANLQGHHSRQVVENHVQIYYYTFLFIQVFLTVSLSAGFTSLIGELNGNIALTPTILAQNLPKASNYFFSYILIQTITTIVSTLVDVNRILSLFILSPLFDKTAREKWARGQTLTRRDWGTFVPVLTNIACIGLIYSVIAPLILIISIIYFGALWLLFRSYPPKLTELNLDPRGLFYPTAIRQLFTGVYFMELCLTGLFFLVRDTNGKAACTAQATIMIFATVATVLFHCALKYGSNLHWLSFIKAFREPAHQMVVELELNQDEALTLARPIVWIPKDELGIADDEISHIRKTYDSIWVSNEGASLDTHGKVRVWGDLPVIHM